jgi:hypothetical protein
MNKSIKQETCKIIMSVMHENNHFKLDDALTYIYENFYCYLGDKCKTWLDRHGVSAEDVINFVSMEHCTDFLINYGLRFDELLTSDHDPLCCIADYIEMYMFIELSVIVDIHNNLPLDKAFIRISDIGGIYD